jgi:adhesin transport system outer membrane protein
MRQLKNLLLSATVLTISMPAYGINLNEAIEKAMGSNPEVLISERNKLAIEQELRQAEAGYLPTVDLTIGSGHERSNNSTTRNRADREDNEGGHRSLWRNETRLLTSQMLFDGFETSNNVKQQCARLKSALKNSKEVKENVSLRVVQAYLDVLRNQELVKLSEDNVANHRRYLKQIQARSSSGRGSKADIRQAEGRLALAESTLYASKGELKNANASYAETVGEKPENLAKYQTPNSLMPASREDAVLRALENNPAIHSAQNDIKAADSAFQATKAAFYPKLDLELEAQRSHNLDGTDEANNSYLAMARVSYNLYNGGADLARKRERSARLEEAKDTLERDRREVEERMYEGWNNLETSKMRLTPLGSHVKSSSETKKAYKSQFDIGQRSLLDLLDTEVEYFNAKTAYINGQYAVDFAMYNVLATSGDILTVFQE